MSEAGAARILDQRCWNHEAREAVCRCPRCERTFCRECVTEYEDRLLCAACLQNEAQAAARPGARFQRLSIAGTALAGVILAWAVFYCAAQSLVAITERSERISWQDR